MQIQADIANVPIIRPKMHESTALGAALAAGHAVGMINITSFPGSDSDKFSSNVDIFLPNMDECTRDNLRDGWRHALESSCDWS